MIDFSFPPEVEEIRLKVRALMDDVVRPEWEAIDQGQRGEVIKAIVKLRRIAREDWGIWLPHMPQEWGGMGLGPRRHGGGSAEAAKSGIGPFASTPRRPTRATAHLAALGHRRAEGDVPPPAVRGHGPLLLRHDRARGRRLRPDAHPDPRLPRRRRVGDQRPQVVHLRRPGRQVRHPHRPHRGRSRDPAGGQQRPSSSTCPAAGWTVVRDVETMSGSPQPLRDPHREPAGARTPTCSAAGARATCSASTASGRPGWPTACAGSARPRSRST